MKLRGRWGPLRSALVISGFFAALRFSGCPFIDLVDARAVDYRFLQRGSREGTKEVVIVAIDDRSIDEVGRWPWPRSVQAKLLDAITAGAPSVVGFDILQGEATAPLDRDTVLGHLGELDPAQRSLIDRVLDFNTLADDSFAAALQRSGKAVLGYYVDFHNRPKGRQRLDVERYSLVRQSGGGDAGGVPVARRAVVNLPKFRAAALSEGYFNVLPDRADGVLRRVPLVLRLGDDQAMPLSLSLARVHVGSPPAMISYAPFGVEEVRLGDISIPTAEDGQLMLNYRGAGGMFEHLSAAALLAGEIDPRVLEGRVVLVGVTATGVEDVRVTPFDGVFPGVEVHATAVDNILRGDFVWQPKWLVVSEMLFIVAGGLLLGLAVGYFRGWYGVLIAGVLLFAYLAGSQWAFVSRGYVFSVLYPMLAFGAVFGAVNIQNYITEERERRRTRHMLELYLSPQMAEFVSERPENLHLGGDRRPMTVLFSDIRGFTQISEGMSPEQLVECLNAYLGEMTDAVFATWGMLDKYVGDAVMAVWGAPLPRDDHEIQAVRTALDMMERLRRFNETAPSRGWPPLEIGIGINTGEMVFGNMGSANHMSLTVMGDEVNLASRLEGLTSLYGAGIIVSEATLAGARGRGDGELPARELDLVRVKGKERPVRIFEIFDEGRRARSRPTSPSSPRPTRTLVRHLPSPPPTATSTKVGDSEEKSREPFTIQSISKPFVYGGSRSRTAAPEAVLARVGVEPTGDAFNSISLEARYGRPLNPMINAGAITATSLVAGTSPATAHRMLARLSLYAGRSSRSTRRLRVGARHRPPQSRHRPHAAQLRHPGGRSGAEPRPLLPPVLDQRHLPRPER
jgi:adenylate cyclase